MNLPTSPKILVLNSGSSSIKYRLWTGEGGPSARGVIGPIPGPEFADHRAGLLALSEVLQASEAMDGVGGIGHRVAHGGESFRAPALIDETVLAAIRENAPFAPLHNPASLLGIETALELYPDCPQVAVFDTAFHQTLAPEAFLYALPYELYEQHGVRRYGFHGTSFAFVARRTAEHLGQSLSELNLILLHLGNGASACAIEEGRSVDTSMGLTPLEGLVMGTRCGDLDPGILLHLSRTLELSAAELDRLLGEESGLLGLCGASDVREVLRRAGAGHERARIALEVSCRRIRKYIGAYLAILGRVDAVVFTGGVGENSPEVRARACDGLENLGIRMDASRNQGGTDSEIAEIQSDESRIKVLVVPTDEEKEIALETIRCLEGASGG